MAKKEEAPETEKEVKSKAKAAEDKPKAAAKKPAAKKTTATKKATKKEEATDEKPAAKKTATKKADAKPKKEVAEEKIEEVATTEEVQAEESKVEEVVEETKTEDVEAEAPAKEEKAKEKPKAAPKKPEPVAQDPNDGFEEDGFDDTYSESDRKAMEKLYSETLTEINEKELIEGTIVGITDREVIVNIGFKSDGLVSLSEFRDMPDLKTGDTVQVYIEEQENANGQLVLSRRKAKIVNAWESIQRALDQDEVIEGFVKRRTKGGLIVDVYGVEAFLPGSQIDVKPIRDFDVFVGKAMEVKVVKINYTNDNVVVSHKVLIEKDLEQQKAEILNNLEKGQVLEGVIKNMTNFGVFIDLGGVDGLLHITDISWGRINHPEEVLKLDEKVNVAVLDFDDNKQRISLGMKQLTDHPWDSLDTAIDVGSNVKGRIVNVADYGAFLEIIPGVEGLIHVSEMSWSQHLRNPSDFINVGDEIEAVVLTIDREERKMSVGIKQLTEDPWTKQDLLTKYAVGTDHKGTVRNLTNFGLFIELEEGIDGLVHVSDLSWTKKIKHPSEYVKVNEELEVKVMELDVENRRLALSHKHLEENPWDTFETVFTKGSVHKCTITALNDKFAVLELPYGLEGQAMLKNLTKEDGTNATEGENLEFKVLEFSKDEKRILLSHSSIWNKEAEQPKAKKAAPSGKKGNTLDKINQEVEKSTLGDLSALSALKDKMEGGAEVKEEKPKAKKAAPKAKKASKEEEKDEEN
ncbi:MAG: 30S ribosomal protein S1 [Cyclobacteriaceae bacterium]